jgi:broad specificity phosphatase PhoE
LIASTPVFWTGPCILPVLSVLLHGGVVRAFFRYTMNFPLDAERNFILLNCLLNRFEKKEKCMESIKLGNVAHLEEMDSLDDT